MSLRLNFHRNMMICYNFVQQFSYLPFCYLLANSYLCANPNQKEADTTQKKPNPTQKNERTTQKEVDSTQKEADTNQKKIGEYLKKHPRATRIEISEALGDITEDGVKCAIARLQDKGLLERVDGWKQGE